MNTYTPGDLVHCNAAVSNPLNHAVIEPHGVVAEVKDPTGTVTTPDVYAEGNSFAIDVDTTGIIPGMWWYRFTSPNPTQGAKEGTFIVAPSEFTA